MRRVRLVSLAALAAVLSVTCKTDGGSGGGAVPTTITLNPNTITFTALASTQQVTVTVLDQNGQPMAGVTLTWSTDNGAIATVSNLGVVSAAGNGNTTVRATAAGGAQGTASVAVAQAAATLSKIQGDNQTGVINSPAPQSLIVEVRDANSFPIPSLPVAFAVTQGGGMVSAAAQATGSNGRNSGVTWTMGGSAGPQQATATVTGLAPVTFSADAIVQLGTVALHEGNGQTGLQGFALNIPPAVIVKDLASTPVAGVQVQFAVTGGGGSVQGATATSGADGVARVGNWIVMNGANNLQATVTTAGYAGGPINFNATGVPPTYNITLRYLTTMAPSQQMAFDSAAARWQRIIYQDKPDIPLSLAAGSCGANSPIINETVDDVLILVTVEQIDGQFGVLGQAGPCNPVRSADLSIIIGRMRLDTADLAFLETTGQLEGTVFHEMGHVLGFGTLWAPKGLVANPSLVNGPGADTHFTGAQALSRFDAIGGTNYAGGAKVPVENDSVPGRADAHWRESVFGTEIMTSFLNNGVPNPLSVVTIGAMGDVGYVVNYAAAEAFSVATGAALSMGAGTRIELVNDVLFEPIRWAVDPGGRWFRLPRR